MDVASSRPGCAGSATRSSSYPAYARHHGFTLIELLAVVAILGILLAYVMPNARSFIEGQRIITHLNSMAGTLYLARSEAILRNTDVVICKSSDGILCSTSGEWEQGWIVFEDRDRDRSHDPNEPVLAHRKTTTGIKVYYRAFGSNNYLVYNSQGMTKTNGTYTFCGLEGSSTARALIVYKTGRHRASAVRSDGNPLSCPP